MTHNAVPTIVPEMVSNEGGAVVCAARNSRSRCVMKPLFGFLLFLACFALVSPASAQRGNRIALLIGHATYPDANTPLGTTVRDARTLADEFKRLDFEVEVQENAGKEEMRRAIDGFTAKIRNGTEALFYFS